MTDTTTAPAAAPAAAAPAPTAASPAPAAPAQAPAASPAPAPADSLFRPAAAPAAAAPAPAPAADDLAWLPEKYRVMGTDGKLDLAASSAKLGEGYAAAVKRIGTDASAPDSPDAYQFTPPEAFKDVPLDAELSKAFRERSHKAGLSQAQFEFVMGEYFNLVPTLLDAKAGHTAEQARQELSKVWKSQPELEAGMSAAERAVADAPAELRQQLKDKYGTDPLFWQFAAHIGRGMGEDRPPANAPAAQPSSADALMASEAYRNPKHPDHVKVSEQVRQYFQRVSGNAPAM